MRSLRISMLSRSAKQIVEPVKSHQAHLLAAPVQSRFRQRLGNHAWRVRKKSTCPNTHLAASAHGRNLAPR